MVAEFGEIDCDSLGFPGRNRSPDFLRKPVILRQNFQQQPLSFFCENNPPGPAISGLRMSFYERSLFKAVHQSRDIRPVHNEFPAQFCLCEPLTAGSKRQIENIKLAGTDLPMVKEEPAHIPKRLRRPQQLQQWFVTRSRHVTVPVHARLFISLLFICQQLIRHDCAFSLRWNP